MAQELESYLVDMAHAAGTLFHEQRKPVGVTILYSDGSCWQPGLGCDQLTQPEWEPVLARTLRSALDRGRERRCRPLFARVWFSDENYLELSLRSKKGLEPAGANDLSQCKQAITSVLHELHQHSTGKQILDEMNARNLIWGDSTVKRALAQMVRDGELTKRRTPRPRGYGLPDWG